MNANTPTGQSAISQPVAAPFTTTALRVVIIEDEVPAFQRLLKLLEQATFSRLELLCHLDSIAAAREWFSTHAPPDIAFVDIHLADGSIFELLQDTPINCPLIFTTAFDHYTLQAFKTNGIDYLLKPVKKTELLHALHKLQEFRAIFNQRKPDDPASEPQSGYKKRFIIRYGENIKTIATEDIAYCFSANKSTCVCTFNGRIYPIDHNLDQLESLLNPIDFFRVNRQYLVHVRAIDEMKTYSKGRVFLTLKQLKDENLVVSSEKSARFKRWLGGEV